MEPKKRIHFMINEAKGWLDLAQESYENDNPVRGELNLHLAQAEIQRACETSREMIGKNMFEISKSRREQQPTWLRYYSLGAVAAMVGILFYMGINLLLFSDGQERTGRSLISASWTAPVQFSWLTEEFFEEEHAVETPHGQSQAVAAQTQRRTSQNRVLPPGVMVGPKRWRPVPMLKQSIIPTSMICTIHGIIHYRVLWRTIGTRLRFPTGGRSVSTATPFPLSPNAKLKKGGR